MSNEELHLAKDMGAATYLSSTVWLLATELKIPQETLTNEAVNGLAELMVNSLHIATRAAFCMLMEDIPGARKAMEELREELNGLQRT